MSNDQQTTYTVHIKNTFVFTINQNYALHIVLKYVLLTWKTYESEGLRIVLYFESVKAWGV